MSTPTPPPPGEPVRSEITRFVADVEKALSDLPADDVAELTDGLEADLTEAWAVEGTTPTQRFGSPQAYAADLRAAAGFPSRSTHMSARWLTVRNDLETLRAKLLALPGAPTVASWAKELQPAWWVLRGPLALVLVVSLMVGLPGDALLIVIGLSLVLAVISLRWRSAAQAEGRRRVTLRLWNALAVAGLLFSWSTFNNNFVTYSQASSWTDTTGTPPAGLFSGGEAVTNVFAYDEHGEPITRFRLYDQNGQPLVVGPDFREDTDEAGLYRKTAPDSGEGPAEWNLFPLLSQSMTQEQMDTGGSYGPLTTTRPPYKAVPALPRSAVPDAQPTADATATGTATTAPSSTPSGPVSAAPSASSTLIPKAPAPPAPAPAKT